MARLTEPQNFFLHLGEFLKAQLDREIAAGDHQSDRIKSERFEEDGGQVTNGAARLELQDHPEVRSPLPVQALTDSRHVWRRADKGHLDAVSVPEGEPERRLILTSQLPE